MTQKQASRQLKDYQVLGVGALRRAEFEKLSEVVTLILHPQLVSGPRRVTYEGILQQTLQWLRPKEILEEKSLTNPQEYIFSALREEFTHVFPQTSVYLQGKSSALIKKYLSEFPWQGPLLSEHFRYFPFFLKGQVGDPALCLLSQKEWILSYLSFADFGLQQRDLGQIVINPSLQTLALNPGLRLFYYDEARNEIGEHEADILDAALLDLLLEDRKYILDQLCAQDQVLDRGSGFTGFSEGEIRKRIHFLISKGILLLSDSAR